MLPNDEKPTTKSSMPQMFRNGDADRVREMPRQRMELRDADQLRDLQRERIFTPPTRPSRKTPQ